MGTPAGAFLCWTSAANIGRADAPTTEPDAANERNLFPFSELDRRDGHKENPFMSVAAKVSGANTRAEIDSQPRCWNDRQNERPQPESTLFS